MQVRAQRVVDEELLPQPCSELRDIDLARDDLLPVRQEAALLEPLGPLAPAAAIEVEDLDLRGAAVEEGEQMTHQRIGLHAVTGDRIQAIEFAWRCLAPGKTPPRSSHCPLAARYVRAIARRVVCSRLMRCS